MLDFLFAYVVAFSLWAVEPEPCDPAVDVGCYVDPLDRDYQTYPPTCHAPPPALWECDSGDKSNRMWAGALPGEMPWWAR